MTLKERADITRDQKETLMTIEQLLASRREMEDAIRTSTIEAMKVFRTKTGVSPQGIDIRLVEVTTLGERVRCFTVADVCADVRL